MFTRFDKAIAAGLSAGGAVYGALAISGDPKHYGLVAGVLAGLGVGIFTFIWPNKALA